MRWRPAAGSPCRGRRAVRGLRRRAPCSGSRRTTQRVLRGSRAQPCAGWRRDRGSGRRQAADAVRAVRVLDDELAAVVLIGRRKKSVAERSVRTRCGVPRTCRTALSTCIPNACPARYRLKSGGNTLSGSAPEMNRVLRSSADTTTAPSSRAGGESSGSCSFSLTRADWWPAVTEPSTHAAAASVRRQWASSSAESTEAIRSSMVDSP